MTEIRTVTIVGVGALGSHLVQALRNEKIVIRCIDFDRVEAKNTLSQFHPKRHQGKLKTEALRQTMQFLFGLKIDAIGQRLTRENTNELLGGSDLVVDCVDNAEGRKLIRQWIQDNDIPCIHGGLAADGSFGMVGWDETFVIDQQDSGEGATCEDGEHLPFIQSTAAYLARAVQLFLRDGIKRGWGVAPSNSVELLVSGKTSPRA